MHLFENEIINISKIHTVNLYEYHVDTTPVYHFNTVLATYELIFFIEADNITHFCGKTIKDIPNSIRYLPKGQFSGSYTVEKKTDSLCVDIYFDSDSPLPDFAVGLHNMDELKPLFWKIYNVWNSKRAGYYTESMSIFYEIIRTIKKHNEKYSNHRDAQKILSAYNYMLDNFASPEFDYKTMCKKSGLSYDYFKELFIRQYKISPVKYVTSLKIEKAKELLLTGQYSVTQTALLCGFENVYYFSTVFKNHTGISPKNYIKSTF